MSPYPPPRFKIYKKIHLKKIVFIQVIDNPNEGEEVWMVTNKFEKVMVGQHNPSEYNYRVLKGNVNELLKNSKCKQEQIITFPMKNFHNENKVTHGRPSQSSGYGYHHNNRQNNNY